MENQAEYYYDQLQTTTNVGLTMAKFYSGIFGTEISRSIIITMNRLIKMFGRFTVYFAILDMFGMEDRIDNKDNPLPLLTYFCKKRTEEKYNISLNGSYEDLTKTIKDIEKKLAQVRKEN